MINNNEFEYGANMGLVNLNRVEFPEDEIRRIERREGHMDLIRGLEINVDGPGAEVNMNDFPPLPRVEPAPIDPGAEIPPPPLVVERLNPPLERAPFVEVVQELSRNQRKRANRRARIAEQKQREAAGAPAVPQNAGAGAAAPKNQNAKQVKQQTRQNKNNGLIAAAAIADLQQVLGEKDAKKEAEKPEDELELLRRASNGEVLETRHAKTVVELINQNDKVFVALKSHDQSQDARQNDRINGRSMVAVDYHTRHNIEFMGCGNYGPYIIQSEHTQFHGGLDMLWFIGMVLVFWALVGLSLIVCSLLFQSWIPFSIIAFTLTFVCFLIFLGSCYWPRKEQIYCERKFSFLVEDGSYSSEDLRLESMRAQKANLTPKIAKMTFDSWTRINRSLMKAEWKFQDSKFIIEWLQREPLKPDEAKDFVPVKSLVAKLEIGLFNFCYFNFGNARNEETCSVSLEKYLQLIVPKNVSPARSLVLNREIIRNKAATMPGINIDKRAPLHDNVEENTILAACLYAEHLRSSTIGRNVLALSNEAESPSPLA